MTKSHPHLGLLPLPKTAVARATCRQAPPVRCNAHAGNGMELVERLTTAFDSASRRTREYEHADRSLQNSVPNHFPATLRFPRSLESVRSRSTAMQNRLHMADSGRMLRYQARGGADTD